MFVLLVIGSVYGIIVCIVIAIGYLVLNSLVSKILLDERYWNQVKEFRADAIGMQISQTTAEILEKALQCIAEDGSIEEKEKSILHFVSK